MKSTLEELYYDNKALVEKIKDSEKYKEIKEKYGKVFEKSLDELSEEQKDMLYKLYDLMGDLELEKSLTYFIAGFKFCMRLVIEGLEN